MSDDFDMMEELEGILAADEPAVPAPSTARSEQLPAAPEPAAPEPELPGPSEDGVSAEVQAPVTPANDGGDNDDLLQFLDTSGLGQQGHTNTRVAADQLIKPWMKFHKFVLVKTIEEVKDLVDRAIKHGRCALDLETEGFDNRIEYNPEIHTVHKIVGFCISVRGVGHYIPVRHKFDTTYAQKDPNVSVRQVEAEIRRLCQASQPVLTQEGLEEDPLASMKIERPPQVVIYFWNAKFDLEFLYPITGIDYWHPLSFECGLLAAYTYYTDDELGLKGKAEERLFVYDPEVKDEKGALVALHYEMIKFEDLFPKGLPRSLLKFADLYPNDSEPMVKYGCSDAICTELLCEAKKVNWEYAIQPAKAKYNDVVSPIQSGKFAPTYKLEKQTAQAVRIVERARAKIDVSAINGLLEEAEVELGLYETKIKKLATSKGFHDFNPGSTQQLSDFLFGKNGLDITPKPPKNEASGQFKTDAGTLEKMFEENPDIEVLEWIVKYRQIDKILGTYLTSLSNNCDKDGQLRFKFVQTGAATGRFTAPAGEADHGYGGIPIQGIPARNNPKKPKVAHSLRRMFVARPGYTLVKVDYAGQELRIVTNLSREPVWLKEFKEGTGDLHTITAQAFFGEHITKDHKIERDMGKIANFSLIYGGGSGAIMRATKCDKVEASRRKANFDKSVAKFAEWVKKQHDNVKRELGVFTAFGRYIRIPDANLSREELFKITVEKKRSRGEPFDESQLRRECEGESRRIRAGCERKATNFPIQGSGADILKISLVRLVKEFTKRGWLRNGGDDSVRMVMTVHDEIVFEVKHERLTTAMPVIVNVMESPSRLAKWDIPLVVEPLVGLTWEAKYDWDKITHGQIPVPEWLVGHVTPGSLPDVELPSDPVGKSGGAPPSSPVKDDVSPESPSALAVPEKRTGSSIRGRVVIFALPRTVLTKQSVNSVRMALVRGTPAGTDPILQGCRLHLTDQEGNTLIDPKLGIHVVPEKFAEALIEYNLGPGAFKIEED